MAYLFVVMALGLSLAAPLLGLAAVFLLFGPRGRPLGRRMLWAGAGSAALLGLIWLGWGLIGTPHWHVLGHVLGVSFSLGAGGVLLLQGLRMAARRVLAGPGGARSGFG